MMNTKIKASMILISLLVVSLRSISHADNWPAWRGPQLTGVSTATKLPTHWTKQENVRWRVELPGPGNSSPIIWGDRVFISQAVDAGKRRTLICFDRANGKILWQAEVKYDGEEPTHENNPHCAGTPATDGERVYVCFGSAGVYAYDFAGHEIWHKDLGKLNHIFGSAVSTILHDDLCILNFGPGEGARLVALDKRSGKVVWEADPPKVDAAELMPTGGFAGRGPGGFGPGMILAPAMFAEADADGDSKVTRDEFSSLADKWFDKLDPTKLGKLNENQFVNNLTAVLPAGRGLGPPRNVGEQAAPGQPPRRGFGAGRFIGPGLFAALDTDKDGTLTRQEMKESFGTWYAKWAAADKSITEDKLRDGLTDVLPRPNFGAPRGRGPGGPGGFAGGPDGLAQAGGSWSTPIVIRANGRDELIVCFPARVVAYDPKTGTQLWLSKGIGGTIYTTPLYAENTLVAMSSGPGGGSAIALHPGGKGDVTDTHRLWRLDRIESQMGSGVISNGHLFLVSQEGIATCLDLPSGKEVWKKRLRGASASGGVWSSMLLANDKIYVANQGGDVFVLAANPEFQLIATNSVDEPMNASLAATDGELFVRTDNALWCVAGHR